MLKELLGALLVGGIVGRNRRKRQEIAREERRAVTMRHSDDILRDSIADLERKIGRRREAQRK